MKRPRFGETKRKFLRMLESGPMLVIQFCGDRAIRELEWDGYVEKCDDQTIKAGRYPAPAYRLTEKARAFSWSD